MNLEGTLRVHQERLIRATGQAAALLLGVEDPTRTLVAAMSVVARALGVDRVTLLRFRRAENLLSPSGVGKATRETLYFSTLYEWARTPKLTLAPLYQDVPVVGESYDCTRWLKVLEAGRTLSIVGLDGLPRDERAMVEAMPVRALIRAPIRRHGQLWGAIGFDRADNERPWLESEERVLQALGDMITALVLRGVFEPLPDTGPPEDLAHAPSGAMT